MLDSFVPSPNALLWRPHRGLKREVAKYNSPKGRRKPEPGNQQPRKPGQRKTSEVTQMAALGAVARTEWKQEKKKKKKKKNSERNKPVWRPVHPLSMIGENRQLVTNEPVEIRDRRKFTDRFIGIYRLYSNLIKENHKMSNM